MSAERMNDPEVTDFCTPGVAISGKFSTTLPC